MGSTLSIVNNTNDVFFCRVGPDMAALQVFTIIATVVTAIAGIAVTGGLATIPAVTALAEGGAVITGLSVPLLTAILNTAVVVGTSQTIQQTISKIVNDANQELLNQGFSEIQPLQKHTYGPMTLSLWQQGECKRTRQFPDQRMFITDMVFMRPIFSGATDQSNLDHEIQFWIDKFGMENEQKFILDPPEGFSSWDEFESTPATTSLSTESARSIPVNVTTTSLQHANKYNHKSTTKTTTSSKDHASESSSPYVCNVCLEKGSKITHPKGLVTIPNYGEFSCSEVEAAGNDGEISKDSCPLVYQFMKPCKCKSSKSDDPANRRQLRSYN